MHLEIPYRKGETENQISLLTSLKRKPNKHYSNLAGNQPKCVVDSFAAM